jgi:four helix bundle protein
MLRVRPFTFCLPLLRSPKGVITKKFQSYGEVYDLEERTRIFASECRVLIRKIPLDIANREDGKQLARASVSVAANYIEANEHLSKKDFVFRIRVCKKESKESKLWLNLLYIIDNESDDQRKQLSVEASELVKIFNSIILKFPREETESFHLNVTQRVWNLFIDYWCFN